MSDLHERLRAAVRARMELARAAPPGPWSTSGPDTIAEWTVYDQHWAVASATAYVGETTIMPWLPRPESYIDANATAAHIAANDPATILRGCERDLRVLERHRLIPPGERCGCDAWLCSCGEHAIWPCDEIRDLAAAYGVEVDG